MISFPKKEKIRVCAAILIFAVLIFGYFYSDYGRVVLAEEVVTFKIVPSIIEKNVGWIGDHRIFINDLDYNAQFKDFSPENSAFPSSVKTEEAPPLTTKESGLFTEEDPVLNDSAKEPEAAIHEADISDQMESEAPKTLPEMETEAAAEQPANEEGVGAGGADESKTKQPEEADPVSQMNESSFNGRSFDFLLRTAGYFAGIIKKTARTLVASVFSDGPSKAFSGNEAPPKNAKILSVSDFGLPQSDLADAKIINAQIRFSFAARPPENANYEKPDKLAVEYFYLGAWHSAAEIEISGELSNQTNGGYFLYALPVFESPDDLKNLKVRFLYLPAADEYGSALFLDAVWVEVQAASGILADKPSGAPTKLNELVSSSLAFSAADSPEFTMRYQKKGSWLSRVIKTLTLQKQFAVNNPKIVFDNSEIDAAIKVAYSKNDLWTARIESVGRIRPGKYKLIFEIQENDSTYQDEIEFYWGVLAINTDKSAFLAGESAYIQMAALTEKGDTICDANLVLEIVDPSGSSSNIPISRSGYCTGNNYTEVSDYLSYYQTSIAGKYTMRLARLDENGAEIYHINDYFYVENNLSFGVGRSGPTRINPNFSYNMKATVMAGEAFEGTITETVPEGFVISQVGAEFTPQSSRLGGARVVGGNDRGPIVWMVKMEKGDELELSYVFDAPDISPALFLLGPLEIRSDPLVFNEKRRWQIASDQTSQYARPDADIAVGSWTTTPLYAKIDEISRSDSDFIYSGNNQTTMANIGLSDTENPNTDTGHILRYTYRKNASGGFSIDFRIRLTEDTTEIASFTHTAIPAAFQEASQALTEAQVANITDYASLSITLECLRGGVLCSGGALANRRGVDVSWAELELPVPVSDTPPTMTTSAPDNITETSATGNGAITDTGGGTVMERGFVWSMNSHSDPGNVPPGSSGYESNVTQTGSFGIGSYSLPLSGLSAGTAYYYRSYGENSAGYAYGNEVQFQTLTALPTVTTQDAANIQPTSVDGNGEVTATGGQSETVTERGFVWSLTSQSDPGNVAPGSSSYSWFTNETGSFGVATFSLTLATLSPDTTYFYRAYAQNSQGYSYGNEKEFSTLGDFPTVSTLTPQNISQASVDGRGNIIDVGAGNAQERGFVWSLTSQPSPGDVAPGSSGYSWFTNETGDFGTGVFSLLMATLSPDTTYFYRAYAQNSQGYAYGGEVEFRTLDELPVVVTNAVSNLKTRSATGNGNITDDGGLTITERGFVWDTISRSEPSSSTPPGSSGYSFYTSETGSFGEGTFNLNMTQLQFNTTYYYRAFAQNSDGYDYGGEISFVTQNAQFSRPSSDISAGLWTPTPLYSRVNSATIDYGTAIFSGDNTSPDPANLGMSAINTPQYDTGHILRYTYKKDASGGHIINFRIRLLQDTTEIVQWLYNDISDSWTYAEQELTEAQAANITNYSLLRVEVIREGDTGGSIRRKAQVSWIELEAPFALALDPPTVTAGAATNIGMFSAQGNGNITDDGNAPITSRGFAWATSSQTLPSSSTPPESSGYSGIIYDTGGPWAEGAFSLTMPTLSANTQYWYRSFAENSEGWGWSASEPSFTTLPLTPIVTTMTPSPIDALFASGRGDITHLGNSAVTERGFVWDTISRSEPSSSTPPGSSGYADWTSETNGGGFSTGIYTLDLTNLNPDTVYYYRAFAQNSDGYDYGGEISFTTRGALPELTTLAPPSPIGPTVATGSADLTFLGASAVTERGFVWDVATRSNPGNVAPASSGYAYTTNETSGGFSTGIYNLPMTGLSELSTYYYRAYARNTDGYAYGNEIQFQTISMLAQVTTMTPENITGTSADGKGNITSVGIGGLTERGFVWDTVSHAQPDSATPPGSTPYPYNTGETGSFGTGIYTLPMSGLIEGSVYYYRSYVLNSSGYTYGNEISFNTPSTRPTLQTNNPTNIGPTSVTGQGTIVSIGGGSPTSRGFVWSLTSQPHPGNVAPGSSGYSDNISENGSFGTGDYSLLLSGLATGSVYFYRSFAQNVNGYNYGNEIQFMTQSPPTINNSDVVLNGGLVIILSPGATESISVTAIVTDLNGFGDLDQSSDYAVIYREGVGEGCSGNENNCYITTNCSLVQTGANTGDLTCTADIQYFAEPTDTGSFSAEKWFAKVFIEDLSGNQGSGSDVFGVELQTLRAIVVEGSGEISYPAMELGNDTGGVNEVVVVKNGGNVAIDPLVSGIDMQESGGEIITVSYQKYDTATFTYSFGGTSLSGIPELTGLSLVKATISTDPVTGDVFWGIGLPGSGLPTSVFWGENTFYAAPP